MFYFFLLPFFLSSAKGFVQNISSIILAHIVGQISWYTLLAFFIIVSLFLTKSISRNLSPSFPFARLFKYGSSRNVEVGHSISNGSLAFTNSCCQTNPHFLLNSDLSLMLILPVSGSLTAYFQSQRSSFLPFSSTSLLASISLWWVAAVVSASDLFTFGVSLVFLVSLVESCIVFSSASFFLDSSCCKGSLLRI